MTVIDRNRADCMATEQRDQHTQLIGVQPVVHAPERLAVRKLVKHFQKVCGGLGECSWAGSQRHAVASRRWRLALQTVRRFHRMSELTLSYTISRN